MTLTDRDKKVVMVLVPFVVLLAYWFLVLGPQRSEATKLGEQLTQVEGDRDSAVSAAQTLQRTKTSYASDYETVVRLGKAVPSSLDMPSLLVQLDSAAKGTGIDFDSITAGSRTPAATTTTSTAGTTAAPTGSGSASGTQAAPPVAAGGQQAQSAPGSATEQANNASKKSDTANQAAGAAPQGAASADSAAAVPGFDTVPLTFSFEGSYFDLADFFHRVKRFVRVANKGVQVKGRLMTIDGMSFKSDDSFPTVKADLTATVYLSPKSQGASAGGTPQGPTGTTTPAAATPASSSGTSTPAPTPAPASSTTDGSGGAQ